jgi:hypothetical protein
MLTILLTLFGILLAIISWFFFKKAVEAFAIVVPENKQPAFVKFCSFNGWAYFVLSLVTFVGLFLDWNMATAIFLIVISLYTAAVAWQIASFIKK